MSINNTMHSYKLSVKRATRRSRRIHQTRTATTSTTTSSSISGCYYRSLIKKPNVKCRRKSKLSKKLQALKNLIPCSDNNNNKGDNIVKPDQLFQETADYIVLLRTRVVVLQKLIEYYDGNNSENENILLL